MLTHIFFRLLVFYWNLNRIPEEIHRAAEKIRHDIGNVSIVVQNAGRFLCKQVLRMWKWTLILFSTGVVTCKNVLDLNPEDIKRTFDVNIISHYHVRIYRICLDSNECSVH